MTPDQKSAPETVSQMVEEIEYYAEKLEKSAANGAHHVLTLYQTKQIAKYLRIMADSPFTSPHLEKAGDNGQDAGVPEGFMLLPTSLTADNGAKHALISEFFIHIPQFDEMGLPAGHKKVPIEWTTIKEIYKAVVAHFAAAPTEMEIKGEK